MAGEELSSEAEYWKRPLAIVQIATVAARKAVKRSAHEWNDGLIEDVSQEVISAYYATSEWSRPKTALEFEAWAYEAAHRARKMFRRQRGSEESDRITYESGNEGSKIDMIASRFDSMYHHVKPEQLLRCEALDAIRMIGLLPPAEQDLVWAVVRSEDVVGYAKDHKVSLFDAMASMKRARMLMNRLADDIADERKEATIDAAK